MNRIVKDFEPILLHLLPVEIELKLELSAGPVPVFVDQAQLEQVLLNLVVNSRDAITENGTITIQTFSDPPLDLVHTAPSESTWLRVIDTGCGIPEEIRLEIFEPFFTTKSPGIGTGLGLATIYGVVSQSGGDIFVDSTVGMGTTMTVVLPASPPHQAVSG